MNLVFTTADVPSGKRYGAWREALCDQYVNVDTVRDATDAYEGFIREARFGNVTVTDCQLGAQTITRRASHLSRIDKDCAYVALTRKGSQQVEQHGRRFACGQSTASFFNASEPYCLRNEEPYRALYLEFPRAALIARTGSTVSHYARSLTTSYGIGRVIESMCNSMVLEADSLADTARDRLGEQVLDLLGMALDGPALAREAPLGESAACEARMRQICSYIDANIGNPLLNPERVARANQMSVRALHYLFKKSGKSVSEYLWERRLERCHEELGMPTGITRTITDVALANGFNSMSHFSTMFRRHYGLTPTDLRAAVSP